MLKAGVTCNVGVFAAYFIIVSLLYTVIFSFLPHIIQAVKTKVEERKPSTKDDSVEMEECDA